MPLQFHQTTYDLLTSAVIDPQRAIKRYTEYYDAFVQGYISSGQYTHEVGESYRQRREEALAWTRLDLYQRPVHFSEANIYQLNQLEEKYHVSLPSAVREWYSLDITPGIMSAPLPEFGFVSISDFKPFSEWMEMDVSIKDKRDDLWYFLNSEYIDQGGESIAFKIDAGDDPPVFAAYDGQFLELSHTFSE